MVNLVIVSHSARLAEGVAELAAEMGGGEVMIEPAGGLDDGSIGTDAERVRAAVERVRSPDGVLVLMDLGSALMSAEIALEMIEDNGGPVTLSPAPLVEGAVAAAARARGGAPLAQVAPQARGAPGGRPAAHWRRRPRSSRRTTTPQWKRSPSVTGRPRDCRSATASGCTSARRAGS